MQDISIKSFIQLFRSQQVRSQLHRGGVQVAMGTLISLLILGLLESVFYFTIPVRIKIVEFFILFFFTLNPPPLYSPPSFFAGGVSCLKERGLEICE